MPLKASSLPDLKNSAHLPLNNPTKLGYYSSMGIIKGIKKPGWKVVIQSNDHPPPHVHVFCGKRTCRVEIGVPGVTPPTLYPWASPRKTTMTPKECAAAVQLVGAHQAAVLAKWEEIHG